MRFMPVPSLLAVSLVVAPLPANAGLAVPHAAVGSAAAVQGPWNPRVPEPDPMLIFLIAIGVAAGAWLLIDALLLGDDDEAPASP